MEFFVITPYKFDQLFYTKRNIVEQSARAFGMTVHYLQFQLQWPAGAFDMKKAHELIRCSDFLIADLTYERPSCYYEIGLAHGLGKQVHLISYDNPHSEYHPACAVLGIEGLRYYSNLDEYKSVIAAILDLATTRS